MRDVERLQTWITYVFDHAVTEPPWYSSAGASDEEWPEAPAVIATHIAETFENGGDLLSRFSDEQPDQGFGFSLTVDRASWLRFSTRTFPSLSAYAL